MRIFCFGCGYSVRHLGYLLRLRGWDLVGTARSVDKVEVLAREGIESYIYDSVSDECDRSGIIEALKGADAILSSVAPVGGEDVVLRDFGDILGELVDGKRLWVGYLSTTGVYGDYGGGWVNESSILRATSERGLARIRAEEAWLSEPYFARIFRLAGIYGRGRSALDSVLSGRARCIYKAGQVFSRIHVDDLAEVIFASLGSPFSAIIYNVCDDEAAPPQDVIAYACKLLGYDVPPLVSLEEADLSAMARSFYVDNKRVCNDRMKLDLGIELRYSNYRIGLDNLFQFMES